MLCGRAHKSGPTYSQCKPGEQFVDVVVGELGGAADEAVALGDVLAGPHRLAVSPVKPLADFLKRRVTAVLAWIFDGDDVVDVPFTFALAVVLPCHSGLELLLEVHT